MGTRETTLMPTELRRLLTSRGVGRRLVVLTAVNVLTRTDKAETRAPMAGMDDGAVRERVIGQRAVKVQEELLQATVFVQGLAEAPRTLGRRMLMIVRAGASKDIVAGLMETV